jgi:hypothetical protein
MKNTAAPPHKAKLKTAKTKGCWEILALKSQFIVSQF